MKRLVLGAILLGLIIVVPNPTMAAVDIHIGIPLPPPPPIAFSKPPEVIALPDTNNVYVAPDVDVDLFFWNGWWWRPLNGRWYRSRHYDRAWVYYDNVPRFYFDVDPGWRGYYRSHQWHGHPWHYGRIPDKRLQEHWKSWQKDGHWEKHGNWGVENYHDRPKPHQRQELSHNREQEYHQRPEVRQHQQWKKEQEKQAGHQGREGGEDRGKGKHKD